MRNLPGAIGAAIQHFWVVRGDQGQRQGERTGSKDTGNRALVTGGKQMTGFVDLFTRLIEEEGLDRSFVHVRQTALPGYYRPSKDWDLVVVIDDELIAAVEFKSHVGPSFGNNFNNRVEEALGNASDLHTAFREGAFQTNSRPWTGYLMLVEDHPKSRAPVKIKSPHFLPFPIFEAASYLNRYDIFCTRLVRERLYDSACLLTSTRDHGLNGVYREPNEELSLFNFAASLQGRIRTAVKRLQR